MSASVAAALATTSSGYPAHDPPHPPTVPPRDPANFQFSDGSNVMAEYSCALWENRIFTISKLDDPRAVVYLKADARGMVLSRADAESAGRELLRLAGVEIDPPSPLTELERRVVEAAIKWDASLISSLSGSVSACETLNNATRALIAARAPKDPVKELRDAWNDLQCDAGGLSERVEAAITALEAAR